MSHHSSLITRYSLLTTKLFQMNMFGGVKLGLDNCHSLQEALDHPTKAFASIHVAGTNGKGSVTTMIAKGLEASGYRVGLFTSPHISCFRERIRINGNMIPEEAVGRLLPGLFEIVERFQIPATFFELTTFLAFLYFAQDKVDFAVLETGLGGRLDATNIVTPILSVITSISLDHTHILGTTLEEIAMEKGGIIKDNVPVVIGPRVPLKIIQEIAKQRGSPLIVVNETFDRFIDENRAIARTAMEQLNVKENALEKGLEASQPCRMEVWKGQVILDVAHNPDGLEHLFKALHQEYGGRPLRLLFGLSQSKDITACLAIICKHGTAFHLVEAPNGRGVPLSALQKELLKLNVDPRLITLHDKISEGVMRARELATASGELLVICGTFFIMSEARQALGYQEPIDAIDMNERMTQIEVDKGRQEIIAK